MTQQRQTRPHQTPATPSDQASPERRSPVWAVVAGREVRVKLTDRNFIISTLVTLVLLAGSLVLQVVLGSRGNDLSVAVSGPGARDVIQQVDQRADERKDAVSMTIADFPDGASVAQAIREEKADAGLVHEAGGWRLVGKTGTDSTLAASVREVVQRTTLAQNAAAAGSTVQALTQGGEVRLDVLEPKDDAGVAAVAGFVFAFLFYLASLLFGMAIASSVVEEKQSRVVEILVTAVPLRQLLMGKVLGNTALALGQMALFLGVGLIGMSFTSFASFLPSVAASAGWFLVFFLAGFVALACLWAVAGSLATRNEDLQSTTPMLTTLLIGALMVGFVGEGTIRTIGSYVPIISTVAMPQRLLAGEAAWSEPVVSLLLTLAFAALAVVVGERLYRRSVMQTQRRLTIREAIRADA